MPEQLTERQVDRFVRLVRDMVGGVDCGAVRISSDAAGGCTHPGALEPPHPWHDEWLHHARQALAEHDAKEGRDG